MFKIFFCCHSKIIEFLHAHFILTMSSSSPVARLSVTQCRCCVERGQNWSLVLFLFISCYTLILNISVSLSHIVPIHVLDNSDLPTSKTCKSGDIEKKPRKTWRLGPQTWRFPKYVLNENKNGRFLVSRYSLPYLCTYCILLPHILKSQFLFRC